MFRRGDRKLLYSSLAVSRNPSICYFLVYNIWSIIVLFFSFSSLFFPGWGARKKDWHANRYEHVLYRVSIIKAMWWCLLFFHVVCCVHLFEIITIVAVLFHDTITSAGSSQRFEPLNHSISNLMLSHPGSASSSSSLTAHAPHPYKNRHIEE